MHSSENSTPNSSTDGPLYLKIHDSTPSDITPNDVWFHGELSEHDANHLLQGTSPGAFLVRQTGNTRFYLSIVDQDGFPKHIPIRQLTTPHYYFEGKRFETLREIVENYPPAAFPVRKGGILPKDGEFIEAKYLCIKSFERREIDEMSAEVGDVITVCETDEPGWMLGRNETNGSAGVIQSTHLEPLITVVDDLAELPYFYDTVSTDMVQFNPIGTFLLRRSSKGPDTYALLVKTQFELVEKFLIVGSPSRGFNLAGRPFPTIGHVLTRYSERAISGGVRLTHAVCTKQPATRRARARLPNVVVAAPMSKSQHEEANEKTRRMFRGASIDTALASSSSASCSFQTAMPSPSTTISTGIPEHLLDRFTDEDNNEHIETTSTVVASTAALRKSREEKQWKDCWLTLSDIPGGSSQLAVFDSMGSKQRQQVDLSTCTMFWLDESVFSTDGCVFLSPSFPQQPALFLCFRPFGAFLKWIRMLRSRTIFQDVVPPMAQGIMSVGEPNCQVSLLSVEIDKFRSEALKPDMLYSANVLLNGVKVGSSNAFAPTTANRGANELPVVVIDSKFVIPCIPTCSTNIQLSVIGHSSTGKKGRPCGVSVSVCLNDANDTVNQTSIESGFVFRAQRTRSPVLPIDRYRPLIEAIRETPSSLFAWPSQVLPQHLKMFMYSCISHLYALNPSFMSPMIRRVITDVLATSTAEDVFRKDSLATGIVTQCLRHLFKTPFDEFLQENSAFLQAVKHQTGPDAAVELLVTFVDQRLMTIPLATRLLVIAADCARERFGEETHLVKRTLSALLILRVLNPIVFATLNTGGGVGSQIAKAVQICANSAASQSTNESLSSAALTIRRIFDRMILLVDQQKQEAEEKEGEMHTEWLSSLAHLIGHSLTLRPSVSSSSLSSMSTSLTSEDVYSSMPLTVLELIRLHQ